MAETEAQAETAPDPDLSGRRIGDYKVLRRLGRGGMAEVYLAQQLSLQRPVALKVLKRSLAGDDNYVRRFHHEARAAANLVQANIVQIYEVGEADGVHFIAQEYVQGQNVKQYLKRHGAVDLFLAINLMRQVAAALHKAAEQGVIHRDIKPENIMISTSGEVKVADFGLARVTKVEQPTDLTQVGITLGTPLYMSPEQVEGSRVDPRSDIYSFGVTCYEMLAGRPPYEGETALAVAVKHLNEEPLALANIRPDLPPELCAIVRRMLEKRPEDRFQSPAELLRELRDIHVEETDEKWAETLQQLSLTDTQILATSQTGATQRLGELMKRTSRPTFNRWHWIGASALALLLAGFAVGAMLSWLNPPQDLLHVDRDEREQIPQRETAEEQYRLAYQLRTERAWQAVGEYFDPNASSQNRYYDRLAKVRLGELYLRQERDEDALRIFESLQQVGSIDREFALIGLAGAAIAYDRLDQESDARRTMSQFDMEFNEYRESTLNGPRDWQEFFGDNDYLRGLLEQLRSKLAWEEAPDVRPVSINS